MTSKAQDLEQTIHHSIPLSRTLGFHIKALGDLGGEGCDIQVVAPLEPNINIHNTAFAGSIYSVGALTAWAFATHLINETELKAEVVLGKAEIVYKRPIADAITCQTSVNSETATKFLSALQSKKRAKIKLPINIGNHAEAVLQATIVATLR